MSSFIEATDDLGTAVVINVDNIIKATPYHSNYTLTSIWLEGGMVVLVSLPFRMVAARLGRNETVL